ncbi:MAG TPA: energy transducer TonB [Terriglobales bacterium]|nr:energy transducer TonB [Terriglobales bacterium]
MGRPWRFSNSNLTILLLVAFVLTIHARLAGADDLEKQLKFDYQDKVLTLRNFYGGEYLNFKADGSPLAGGPVGPWTIDGQLSVNGIALHGEKLKIKGRRLYLIYDIHAKQFEDYLTFLRDYRGKDREKLEKLVRKRDVEVEIEFPSSRPGSDEVSSAMRAVFLAPDESMAKVVPPEWRAYFGKQDGEAQTISEPGPMYRVGAGVSPPRAILDPEPEYSETARELKYQGVMVLYLVVDASGNPRDIRIVTPMGLGLDEKAVVAVSNWKFEPARKDGQPVAVAVNIQVTFHLY